MYKKQAMSATYFTPAEFIIERMQQFQSSFRQANGHFRSRLCAVVIALVVVG